MKGKTEIILTDSNGNVERYEESNMVTNALLSNYNGMPYGISKANLYSPDLLSTSYNKGDLESLAGGLLLFSSNNDEDANNLYAPFDNTLTGYASNDAYAGEDSKRGSFNSTESTAVEGGYKFVWDFATNQANGTIKSVSLTHVLAGRGPLTADENIINGALNSTGWNARNESKCGKFSLYANNLGSASRFVVAKDTSSIIVMFADGVARRIAMSPSKINFSSIMPNGNFFRAQDFTDVFTRNNTFTITEGSNYYLATNTATAITWTKYNMAGASVGTGSWSVPSASLKVLNDNYHSVIVGGRLYMPKSDDSGFYSINISNLADITFISISGNIAVGTNGDYGEAVGGDFWHCKGIIHSGVNYPIPTAYYNLPFERNGIWLSHFGRVGDGSSTSFAITEQLNYLATINNIDIVTKTPDKTMKIIYTLLAE